MRPARLEQLEHLVQWRHVQDVLHPARASPRPPGAALQRDDRPDLDLVVRVDEDQVLRVEDADDVLAVALPDGDAGVTFFFFWFLGVSKEREREREREREGGRRKKKED